MSGSFDDNLVYISRLLEGILDQKSSIDPMSQSAYNKLLDNFSVQIGKLADASNVTKSELKNIIAYFKTFVSSYDLKSTEFNKTVQQLQRSLEGRMEGGEKLEADKLLKGLSNLFTSAVLQSIKAEERGKKGTFKNVIDNEKLQAITKDLAERMGVKSDATANKIIEFFKEQEKKREKRERGFTDDLIEGLEKSKWVGGALRDTFALIGLLGGRFMSQFGPLGRKIGAAFYVAMITAGPILTQMLMKGIGGVLKNTLPMLKEFLFPGGQNVGNMIGAGLGLAGAMWAGKEAKDSERRGMKGNATAFKVGGAGMAAGGIALGTAAVATSVAGVAGGSAIGGIAAAIAAALGPIGWTLLGIGAAIAGLAYLWKNHSETIKKWAKKFGDFVGKVIDFMALFNPVFAAIKWMKDNWEHPIEGIKNTFAAGVAGFKRFAGIQETKAIDTVGGVGINKYGGVIGLEKVDKMKASAIAEQYFAEHPEKAGRMYEKVGSKYASLGSFENDWAIRNAQGTATAAVLHAGASAELEGLWGALVSSGAMTREKAEMLKYTSGRSTKSSPHKGTGLNSHQNISAMVTDMAAANSWTDEEWRQVLPIIQEYLAGLGYEAMFEGEKGGKTYFGKEFVAGLSNRHLHVQMAKGKEDWMPEGVKYTLNEFENQKKHEQEQKASVMAGTANLLKYANKDKYEAITAYADAQHMSDKARDIMYKDALKREGYEIAEGIVGKPWMKDGAPVHSTVTKENGGLFFTDPTGIKSFSAEQLQQLSNGGSGGN